MKVSPSQPLAVLARVVVLVSLGCAGDAPALPPETGNTIGSTGTNSSSTTSPTGGTTELTAGTKAADSLGGSGCTSDADCGGPTPACEPISGDCVECVPGGEHCAPQEYCDATTSTCLPGCTSDADCDGRTPVCDPASNACVGCVDGEDCGGATPACDPTGSVCVGCVSDGDCGGGTPVCNPMGNVCVECVGAGDCGAGVCTANVCVTLGYACSSDADCDVASGEECCTEPQCLDTCMIPCLEDRDCPAMVPAMGCAHDYCLFPCSTDADCTDWPGYTCQHAAPNLCENDEM